MTPLVIRKMTLGDYEQVHAVDMLTQRQYLGTKFEEMSPTEQDTHLVSRKSEFQINVDTGFSVVAEKGKKIVGFILAYETLPFRGIVAVRYIGINPDFQGEGVGLLLYKKLIDTAKHMGIKEIHAFINPDNPHSIRLHEKVGFRLVQRKEAILDLNKQL